METNEHRSEKKIKQLTNSISTQVLENDSKPQSHIKYPPTLLASTAHLLV